MTEFAKAHPVVVRNPQGKIVNRFATVRCAAATVAFYGVGHWLHDETDDSVLSFSEAQAVVRGRFLPREKERLT